MAYLWNSTALGAVFALPAAAADRANLRLTGAAQLKVLLWFARAGRFDPEACAADTAVPASDCVDAMRFWVERGVLTVAETAEDAPAATETVSAEAVPAPTVSPAPMPPLPPLTATPEKPRPQFPDVVARQKSSPDFDYLLRTAEQRLGRPLTHGEMETFLYIYDSVGLPAEVILMILVNAVRQDKVRVKSGLKRYLEKIATDWAERGIVTIAAAEQEFCREERLAAARERVHALFLPDRTPTLLQAEAMVRWTDEWGFSEDVLQVAFERCRAATGKFQSGYMDRILESWHLDGITTPDEARATSETRRSRRARPLPSDDDAPVEAPDEYERAAAAYRPVYHKKDE